MELSKILALQAKHSDLEWYISHIGSSALSMETSTLITGRTANFRITIQLTHKEICVTVGGITNHNLTVKFDKDIENVDLCQVVRGMLLDLAGDLSSNITEQKAYLGRLRTLHAYVVGLRK